MKLDEFNFDLPERLIAQTPAPERDRSRMMVVWRQTGKIEHHLFRDLPSLLDSNHFLVINNTRVFPARLRAARPGKNEEIEILLVKESGRNEWFALVKPGRKAPPGQKLIIGGRNAQVLEITEIGNRRIRFAEDIDLANLLEQLGEPPLPPYISRARDQDLARDKERYQTIFARHSGSIAAPTAGLHFTEQVFQQLRERGVSICELLLHVGYGTFKPVRVDNIEEHQMESEDYEVDRETAARILRYKSEGKKLISVGTTSTRCLEHLALQKDFREGGSGSCNLFIYPGFEFHMLDGLITNFHLPKSTLFMLASAFAGRELLMKCYREAISREYRFYSYGDCMLIL